jgi:hypothetical protein
MDKLFATIYTILTSFTSFYYMFLFAASAFNGYIFIHHPATHRAEVHRSVNTAMIEIWTSISLYHLSFDPLYTTDWLSVAKNFINPGTYLFLVERSYDGLYNFPYAFEVRKTDSSCIGLPPVR